MSFHEKFTSFPNIAHAHDASARTNFIITSNGFVMTTSRCLGADIQHSIPFAVWFENQFKPITQALAQL